MHVLLRRPFALLGPAMVVGILVPTRSEGGANIVLVCILAVLALGMVGSKRVFSFAMLAAAVLLGHGSRLARPEAVSLGDLAPLRGVVVRSEGRHLVVEQTGGTRVAFTWPNEALPAPGDWVAALTEAKRIEDPLPGDVSGFFRDTDLGAAQTLRALDAIRIQTPGVDVGDEWLRDARNRGLLRAFVTGDRRELTDGIRLLLKETGTTHLLSVSGLHVGMIATFAYVLSWLPSRVLGLGTGPWMRAVPSLCAAVASIAFTAFVGSPAPAVRAAWMTSVGALVQASGRRVDMWNLWGVALCASCLVEPGVVQTLSFQLSYAAMAGMLAVTPVVLRWLPPDVPRPVTWFVGSLATSLGATLGTLPWAALVFQELAPLGFIANLAAVPLSGFAVPAALVARFVPGPLGDLGLWSADRLLDVLLVWLEVVRAPLLHPSTTLLGALALCVVPFLVRQPFAALGVAVIALGVRAVPTHVLTVTFLAVGQGDAALVEWPNGERWLVDGGPSSTDVLRYLRWRGIHRLDAVVLSHPHPDHLSGLLPVLEALDIGELWVPRPPRYDESDFRRAWLLVFQKRAVIRTPAELDGWVEHPLFGWTSPARSDVNDESLVIRLAHGQHTFLFTGDIEGAAERWLTPFTLPATVVKVPHHGSKTSSREAFVDALDPEWAVISCGLENRFGHPAPLTVSRWWDHRLARTDRDGTIRFRSDGRNLRVDAWNPESGWRELERLPARPIDSWISDADRPRPMMGRAR